MIAAPDIASEELSNSFKLHDDFVSFNVQTPLFIKLVTRAAYESASRLSLFII